LFLIISFISYVYPYVVFSLSSTILLSVSRIIALTLRPSRLYPSLHSLTYIGSLRFSAAYVCSICICGVEGLGSLEDWRAVTSVIFRRR